MIEREHLEQRAYFDWARLHPLARRAFAIPNGRKRTKAEAGKLRAEGVRAGVLDVMLPLPRGAAAGLWIEFKAGKNTLTPEQRDECERLAADGYAVAVAWSALDAIDFTQAYLAGQVGPGIVQMRKNLRSGLSMR